MSAAGRVEWRGRTDGRSPGLLLHVSHTTQRGARRAEKCARTAARSMQRSIRWAKQRRVWMHAEPNEPVLSRPRRRRRTSRDHRPHAASVRRRGHVSPPRRPTRRRPPPQRGSRVRERERFRRELTRGVRSGRVRWIPPTRAKQNRPPAIIDAVLPVPWNWIVSGSHSSHRSWNATGRVFLLPASPRRTRLNNGPGENVSRRSGRARSSRARSGDGPNHCLPAGRLTCAGSCISRSGMCGRSTCEDG